MENSTAVFVGTEEEVKTQHGEPEVAHIVQRRNEQETAGGRVLESYVEGTPLTALCGTVFVPSRDPKKLPICEPCKELYTMARGLAS